MVGRLSLAALAASALLLVGGASAYAADDNGIPYEQLIEENARRTRDDFEFELLDTGAFDDDRYWVVDVTYAKESPTDVLALITVENKGPDEATLEGTMRRFPREPRRRP